MTTDMTPIDAHPSTAVGSRRFAPIAGAEGRRVVLIAVHHVRVGDITYTGGAEKYIQTVIPALIDAGALVHVGYSGSSIYDHLLETYHPNQLTVEKTDWLDDVLSGDRGVDPSLVLDRIRWFRATHADTALFVQQASGSAYCASLLAARAARLRVVSSLRQPPQPIPAPPRRRIAGVFPRPGLWRRRVIWRHRLPAMLSQTLVYNSERVAEEYEQTYAYPRGKRCVIHNGASAIDACPSRASTHRIATVGRLTEAKGADRLLSAFERIAREDAEAELTYYGDGPWVDDLRERCAEAGLNGRVRLAGFVQDRDAIYANVDIYVHASQRESMSNSVIEAMARGIPCIVTDVGGMREAIVDGECGLVVPPDDADALVNAIRRLRSDRATYDRCSAGALARAKSMFDERANMERMVRAVLGI
ncbi:MAG: glycosyltransferase family 4 protein [Phycisphaerales bacterium]|nr:glycosyltransferase family 4 protein [Phycisphaerales bacterium]MCB9864672.1 glycosyltransferase family 4 protein [Phycisphaerales bacterium]